MSEIPWQHEYEPTVETIGLSEWKETQESLIPQEVQQKLEKAGWNDSMGNQAEEYNKFSQYISSLSPEKQQEVFQMILWANSRKLKKYINTNGYILGATLSDFGKKFWKKKLEARIKSNQAITETKKELTETNQAITETKKELTETNQEITEINENKALKSQESLSQFRDVFESQISSFQDETLRSYLKQSIQLFSQWEKLDLSDAKNQKVVAFQEQAKVLNQQIKNHLAQGRNLENIAKTFKDNGDEQGYNNFKKYAESLDSSSDFSQRFIAFESAYKKPIEAIQPSDFRQAQIVWAMGTENFEKYGNVLESNDGGDITRMDISQAPPSRYIALEGSQYSLETDVPVGDFYTAISNEWLAYESTVKENTPKIEAMAKLGSAEVAEYLQSDDFEKATLSWAKAVLTSMLWLAAWVTLESICGRSFSSKEDIKNFVLNGGIASQKQKLEKEIEKEKKEYQKALKQYIAEYSKKLKEEDEQKRNTLKLMKNIGLDIIPQADLEQLIAEINIKNRIDLWDGIQTNTDIDLAEWVFWFSDSIEWNSDRENEVLVRLFNKMVTGVPNWDGAMLWDVAAYGAQRVIADPIKIRAELEKRDIITSTGWINISKIRQNLWWDTSQKDEKKDT